LSAFCFYGAGELFHRRSGFFERGRLLLRAAGQVRIAGRDLGRRRGDRHARLGDPEHRLAQLLLHPFHRRKET
jgi:hypothetical protein